ncbi:golgi apparatus membrane protein tvp23 [Phaffia rhodozyma]|uniref:Golgi apparatus membrane protein TVP23 n=1 Tax=Phaffia rhodozyma TaxID=264483 RepID=A0A0F7SRS7_PHARH|nr:golgi apparatus membrane protein tvp23 [Phaffia rhodozyma]
MESTTRPLLSADIEPDSNSPPGTPRTFPSGNIASSSSSSRPPRQADGGLPPPVNSLGSGSEGNNGDEGIVGMIKRSSHPMALLSLYFFRSAAITVYVLCGLFTDNYVLSIVLVVVLLSMDFWVTRNVAGRTLVGLRYWNQVDEDGESSWVFESRDPSVASNAVDSKLFWTALYVYPVGWAVLFFVSLLKFSVSFLPIVALALVFNLSNVLGFTYADRDAKARWANSVSGGMGDMFGMSGLGGQVVGGMVKSSLSRVNMFILWVQRYLLCWVNEVNEDLTESDDTTPIFRESTFTTSFCSSTTYTLSIKLLINPVNLPAMPPLTTTAILLSTSESSRSPSDMNRPRLPVPPRPQRPPNGSFALGTSTATTSTSNLPEPTRAISPSYPATGSTTNSAIAGPSTFTRSGRTRASFETLTNDTCSPSETGPGSQRPRKRIHLDLRDQSENNDNNKRNAKANFTSATKLTEEGRVHPKRRVIPPPPVDLEGEDASKELITEYNCPICLCPPSEACVTPCGHLMCFACLRNTLLANPQSAHRHATQPVSLETNLEGSCPVCRKVLPGGLLGYGSSKGKGKSKSGKKTKPGVVKIELRLIDLVKE